MLFEISRTSNWGDSQPHEKSYLDDNGNWVIKISDMSELLELVKDERIVLSYDNYSGIDRYCLEIYDDYRE